MIHPPGCAIFRQGNIRAYCDCGIDPPVQVDPFKSGQAYERAKVVARLRFGVKEFRSLSDTQPQWELVAEILKEEADAIESGDY